jgi:hypothetical protein
MNAMRINHKDTKHTKQMKRLAVLRGLCVFVVKDFFPSREDYERVKY